MESEGQLWEQEESTALQIKMTFIAIRREIGAALRPLGLTSQQAQTLHILATAPGATNADLEKLLCIEKPSVTSLINGLEKRGLVVRRPHCDDARVREIYITEQGRELHTAAHKLVAEVKKRTEKAISREEAAVLHQLLRRIREAYEA